MNKRAIFIWFFIASVYLMGYSNPNTRKLAWKTPAHIEAVLVQLNLQIDPNLPAPVLDHEKPYTRGTGNTVTWIDSMAAVYEQLQNMQMTIQFWAIEAQIVGVDTVWGFVDSDVDSASFKSWPEGIPVHYRLRYYAQDTAGNIHMSAWSRPEVSIQDASAPEIVAFEILQLQNTCENPWVLGPQIQVNIHAADKNGKIMQVAIQEIGVDRILFDDLDARPRALVDTTIQYSLLAQPNTPLTLKCWAVDVAEFYSDTMEIHFFYMPSDPKVACFPNPFLPDQNRCTIIKVEKAEVSEAKIFDAFGNLVKILHKQSSSDMSFEWNGKNERGEQVAKGGYICVIDDNRDLYCKIAVIR